MDGLREIANQLNIECRFQDEDIEIIVEMLKYGMTPESISKIIQDVNSEVFQQSLQASREEEIH